MESWELSPRYFETMHHLIQHGIVLINLNLRSPFHFIPLSMYVLCLNSRCFNISFHELILSARSSRRSIPVEFLSVIIVLDEDLESKDAKINLKQWIMKIVLASVPSVFLPHVLNLGTRFLFSGGELSQPQINPCLFLL